MMNIMIFVFATCFFQATVSQLTGAWSDVEDTDSPEFQKVVDFATEQIAAELGSPCKVQVIHILCAQEQSVAGKNYKITMRVSATDCNTGENYSNCEPKSCGDTYKCTVEVWDTLWSNDISLSDLSCNEEKKPCTSDMESE